MTMHWLRNTVLALAIATLPAAATLAAEDHAVRPFTEHGVIDAPPEQGVVVISDSTYHLSDRTKVSTLEGKAATVGDLQQGVKVGFNMYGTRAERYISDIWILPPRFDFDTLADE